MAYKVQPGQSQTFLATCYKLRSEQGREAEARLAVEEHVRVFGTRPNPTWGPTFVCCRVAYKLFCDDPTTVKTEVIMRRAKVMIYHPETVAKDDDFQTVTILDRNLKGDNEMTTAKKATKKATTDKQSSNAAPATPGRTKAMIVGHPASSVLRWLGNNGYTVAQARAAVASLGFGEVLKDSTIVTGVNDGKHGDKYGPVAALTPAEEKELKRHIPANVPATAKAQKAAPAPVAEPVKKAPKKAQKAETPAPTPTPAPAKKVAKKAVKSA